MYKDLNLHPGGITIIKFKKVRVNAFNSQYEFHKQSNNKSLYVHIYTIRTFVVLSCFPWNLPPGGIRTSGACMTTPPRRLGMILRTQRVSNKFRNLLYKFKGLCFSKTFGLEAFIVFL
jgi:hypothetical protein